MKKLINFMLLTALMVCQYSCIDCEHTDEPVMPEEEIPVEVKVIVTTGEVSDITSTSAIITGSVENIETLTEGKVGKGIMFNTDSIVSLGSYKYFRYYNGRENGWFAIAFDDLEPGTTYYYRACVVVDNSDYTKSDYYYGEVKSFRTEEKSVIVTTGIATDITSSSAVISGSVENLASYNSNAEIGVVYGINTALSINNGTFVSSSSNVNGEYTVSLTGLSFGTTYYYRACVKIDDKVYYGELSSFITKDIIITTGVATNITSTSAVISGSVENLVSEGQNIEIGVYFIPDFTRGIGTGNFISSDQTSSGEFSVKITNLFKNTTYDYKACVIIDGKKYYGDEKSFTTKDEITPSQEVDLGLSVKWAGWNVGASSPEQYGGYYAWGETEEKSDYGYDTYKYWQNKNNDGFCDSNEFINIGSNISGTQYDVAHVKWGNGWRMPTKEEIQELNSKCKFEGYTYNGVAGCKVTGPNGNSIFLPCAGGRFGTSLYGAGSYGNYWSGSLSEYNSYDAWGLYFLDDGGPSVDSNYVREYGHSVRPVR